MKEKILRELNKFYGAMFECGDFEALEKLVNNAIDEAHLKGYDEGIKEYIKAQEEEQL